MPLFIFLGLYGSKSRLSSGLISFLRCLPDIHILSDKLQVCHNATSSFSCRDLCLFESRSSRATIFLKVVIAQLKGLREFVLFGVIGTTVAIAHFELVRAFYSKLPI